MRRAGNINVHLLTVTAVALCTFNSAMGCLMSYNIIQTHFRIKIHNNNTNLQSSLLTLILRFTHGHYETKLSPRTQESRYANKIAKTKRARLKNPESKLSSRNFFRKWEISQWKKSQFIFFCKNYFQKLNFIQETYLTFDLNFYNKKVRAYYNKKVESAWCVFLDLAPNRRAWLRGLLI